MTTQGTTTEATMTTEEEPIDFITFEINGEVYFRPLYDSFQRGDEIVWRLHKKGHWVEEYITEAFMERELFYWRGLHDRNTGRLLSVEVCGECRDLDP